MIRRRDFVKTGVVGGVGVAFGSLARVVRGAGIAHLYAGLDSGRFFDGDVRLETDLGDPDAFTEGPAQAPGGEVFFTDITASVIHAWDPKAKRLRTVREGTNAANGLLFDPEGRLLACEGAAGRVTRMDLATGTIEVLADEYGGLPLEAPNDLVQDRAGRTYFTSRPAGAVEPKGNLNAVYRIDPDGSLHRLLHDPQVHMPNGVVLSPDQKTLHLVDADGAEGRYRNITAWDLRADGSLANRRVLVDFYPGRSGDGMCVDEEGNLYVAAGLHARRGTSETLDTRPGIHVFSPSGELLAYARTPRDTVTNCTFGGEDRRTLYVTCGPLLLSLETRIPGLPAKKRDRTPPPGAG